MNGPELCVSALVVRDDELLLVRRGRGRAAGTWALPGGRVQEGELLAEAVVRELAEETALEGVCGELVGYTELLGETASPAGERGHAVVLTFRVHLLGPGAPAAGDDAAEAAWVALGEVTERPLAAGVGELLTDHGIVSAIGQGRLSGPSRTAPASRRRQ